jgi:23S rRNA-/tRNA-specific pseudouridylate synthase
LNKQQEHFEVHIPVQNEVSSPVDLLSAASGLSKQSIKQVMQNGAVWLSRGGDQGRAGGGRAVRRIRRAKLALAPGDELHLYYDQAIQASQPDAAQLIADESAYSVWFKPAGMFSLGSKWGDHCTINRWAEKQLQRQAFIVHRLDRAASGLILIAHTKTMATQLSRLFEQRLINKRYRALVHGEFEPEPVSLDSEIDGRQARSKVALLDYNEASDRSLLAVEIETGRKHQIRRHLSEAGYPIVGDRLYGKQNYIPGEDDDEEDLQLIAEHLAFVMPDTGEEKTYFLPESLVPESLIPKPMQGKR